MAKKKVYKYKVFQPKKAQKEVGVAGVELEDGTQFIIYRSKKHKGLAIRYPKKKFSRLFLKQINDKKAAHISMSYSPTELEAIFQGMMGLDLKK